MDVSRCIASAWLGGRIVVPSVAVSHAAISHKTSRLSLKVFLLRRPSLFIASGALLEPQNPLGDATVVVRAVKSVTVNASITV